MTASRKFRPLLPFFLSLVMIVTLFGNLGANEAQAASVTGNDVVNYAKSFLGKPYKNGATGPKEFDNWAFTDAVYQKFGLDLKNGVYGQSRQGKYIKKGQALQKGDLVFFGYGINRVIHVGIYIGDNKFIDAYKYSDKVSIQSMTGIYKKYYLGARRVIQQASAPKATQPKPADNTNNTNNTNNRTNMEQRLVEAAQKYVGVDYKLGGDYNWDGTYAFDCSGYVKRVFFDIGIKDLPRTATKQYKATKDRQINNFANLKPGDLLFFDLNRNGGIDHNGIYIGNGKFIHASTANGGKVQWGSITNNRFWKSTLIKATRVL